MVDRGEGPNMCHLNIHLRIPIRQLVRLRCIPTLDPVTEVLLECGDDANSELTSRIGGNWHNAYWANETCGITMQIQAPKGKSYLDK
jgi:hypothetical protein